MSPARSLLMPERLRLLVKRGGQPLRFAMAGTINTIFGLSIYPILRLFTPSVHYMATLGIAQALSLAFAYATYKMLAFRQRGNNVLREMGMFSSFYLVSIALNWIALPGMVRLLHLAPVVAQTGFSLLVMISSYFWHSKMTFRSAKAS